MDTIYMINPDKGNWLQTTKATDEQLGHYQDNGYQIVTKDEYDYFVDVCQALKNYTTFLEVLPRLCARRK